MKLRITYKDKLKASETEPLIELIDDPEYKVVMVNTNFPRNRQKQFWIFGFID